MKNIRLQDTGLRHRNREASHDLILPISLYSTVREEEAVNNMRENMAHRPWLNTEPAHGRVAILCGNGPSLTATIPEIQAIGGDVFACNDASNALSDGKVNVRYQVILEAHPDIVDEFDHRAHTHLLASMAHPELFRMAKCAALWHPDREFVEREIPADCPPFCYIGGSATVSMFAMSIAYTMGYRKILCYGLDSSHYNGKMHASREFQIPGRLEVTVEEFGNEYRTTYDMKEQVVVFLAMARQLDALGCKVEARGMGLLPDVWHHRHELQPLPLTT